MILGAEVFEKINGRGLESGKPLLAQETKLGWVLSGNVPLRNTRANAFIFKISASDFLEALQHFFDYDDMIENVPLNDECEISYQSSIIRYEEGRYAETLPFKDDPKIALLRNSRNKAFACFKQLEKRLVRAPDLRRPYHETRIYPSAPQTTNTPIYLRR